MDLYRTHAINRIRGQVHKEPPSPTWRHTEGRVLLLTAQDSCDVLLKRARATRFLVVVARASRQLAASER